MHSTIASYRQCCHRRYAQRAGGPGWQQKLADHCTLTQPPQSPQMATSAADDSEATLEGLPEHPVVGQAKQAQIEPVTATITHQAPDTSQPPPIQPAETTPTLPGAHETAPLPSDVEPTNGEETAHSPVACEVGADDSNESGTSQNQHTAEPTADKQTHTPGVLNETTVKPPLPTPAPTAHDKAPLGVSEACLRWLLEHVVEDVSSIAHAYCKKIKKFTENQGCAFVDMANNLQQQQPGYNNDGTEADWVAPATNFVSHTWNYPFAVPLEIMYDLAQEARSTTGKEAYFWFDVFSNNQHAVSHAVDTETLSHLFGSSVLAIGRVDLVLSPWKCPVALQRSWCIWEIISSLNPEFQGRVELQLHLPRDEEKAFMQACTLSLHDGSDAAIDAMRGIDCMQARASQAKDQAMIQEALAARGTDYVNQRLQSEVRQWCYDLCLKKMPALAKAAEAREEWFEACEWQWAIGKSLIRGHAASAPALAAFETALELMHRQEDDSQQKPEATLLGWIANTYSALGQYDKALEYHFQSLKLFQALSEEESTLTATSYSNIGSIYQTKGQYAQSLEYHLKALQVHEQLLGSDNVTTATSYNNIAEVYRILGQSAKALEYQLKCLEVYQAVLGEKHESTATAYNNVGMLYEAQGQYDEALDYHLKSLAIKQAILGDDHPSTAISYNNIGMVYYAREQYPQALEYQLKSLEIHKAAAGDEHISTATSYSNVGNNYQAQGQYAKALEYHFMDLKITRAAFGENHLDTAACLNSISINYQAQGKSDTALEYGMRSLNATIAVLGERNMSAAASYSSVTRALEAVGQYDKALEFALKSLAIKQALLGEHNVAVAASHNNLGRVYEKLENWEMALQEYTKAREIDVALRGPNHLNVGIFNTYISRVHYRQGQLAEALELSEQALAICLQAVGRDHVRISSIFDVQGCCYMQQQEFDKAVSLLNQALDIRKAKLHAKHPDLAEVFYHLGQCYTAKGSPSDAKAALGQALAIQQETQGMDHPDTRKTQEALLQLDD
eukprot:m.227354 g.227354  ORF g.227354 m.227354 type:complete len:1018 (+) comp17322_c0_seq7:36-3089(+)